MSSALAGGMPVTESTTVTTKPNRKSAVQVRASPTRPQPEIMATERLVATRRALRL
jgi:hypothetical protein